MSYELRAVIGDFDLLRSVTAETGEAVVVPLRQRMGLLPVADRPLGTTLARWSAGGPLAVVAAEFFGGVGEQSAAVWRGGAREWGPVRSRDFTGARTEWPVNAALARIGVVARGADDLFAELGLGRERDMDGWRRAGRETGRVGSYEEWAAEEDRAVSAAVEAERRRRVEGVPAALDGREVMALLGLPPGPSVGAATRHLRELHLELGPLARAEAVARLRSWAREQGLA
ncbi:hypothetical protein ACIRBX_33670 [Kitasatospora sp. NPDC096147]|uniref:hypothetical protein n=1 Tax=Kitasatospora sp. NPDC096147 TaxID=3364093 RepID=UPI0038287526